MGGAGVRIYEDLRAVQRRLGVVQAVVALAVAGLLVYFWHLQVIRGKYFRDLAENNRIRAVPIPAPRGPLFDRKERILAENRSSFNVIVTTERKDELGGALERLSKLISFDPGAVRERLNTQGPRFRSVVVKADASDEDVATIEARRMEEPEASVDVVPLRSYPLGVGPGPPARLRGRDLRPPARIDVLRRASSRGASSARPGSSCSTTASSWAATGCGASS